jgi:hypothetical protein
VSFFLTCGTGGGHCHGRAIDGHQLQIRGAYGLWPAVSEGDDIVLVEAPYGSDTYREALRLRRQLFGETYADVARSKHRPVPMTIARGWRQAPAEVCEAAIHLGHENEEAIRSGAWWFYQKIGFQPRSYVAGRLLRQELARMRRRPGHRSSPQTLRSLARHNLYYYLGRPRSDVIGADFLPNVGLKISNYLAQRFGSDGAEAARVCSREAAAHLQVGSLRGFTVGERLAWERWAPLVCVLPGVARWRPADKQSLVRVIRAKGGRRESEFALRFDRHRRLREAILRLTGHRRPRR